MHGLALLLTTTTLAVDYGWDVRPDGGVDYIVQIEPELLDKLRVGETITSEIDPRLRNIRSIQIRVGRDKLPKQLPPTALETTERNANSHSGANSGLADSDSIPLFGDDDDPKPPSELRPGWRGKRLSPDGVSPAIYQSEDTGGPGHNAAQTPASAQPRAATARGGLDALVEKGAGVLNRVGDAVDDLRGEFQNGRVPFEDRGSISDNTNRDLRTRTPSALDTPRNPFPQQEPLGPKLDDQYKKSNLRTDAEVPLTPGRGIADQYERSRHDLSADGRGWTGDQEQYSRSDLKDEDDSGDYLYLQGQGSDRDGRERRPQLRSGFTDSTTSTSGRSTNAPATRTTVPDYANSETQTNPDRPMHRPSRDPNSLRRAHADRADWLRAAQDSSSRPGTYGQHSVSPRMEPSADPGVGSYDTSLQAQSETWNKKPAEDKFSATITANQSDLHRRGVASNDVNSSQNSIEQSSQLTAPKRWMPLIFTMLALFVSVGINIYLGKITWDAYNRYQDLLEEMQPASSAV